MPIFRPTASIYDHHGATAHRLRPLLAAGRDATVATAVESHTPDSNTKRSTRFPHLCGGELSHVRFQSRLLNRLHMIKIHGGIVFQPVIDSNDNFAGCTVDR